MPDVEALVGDITDLSRFADDTFDATVCFGGPLSYVVDRAEQAVAELVRVTKPGGHVLVSVMGLGGAVIHFASIIVELARRDGPAKSLEIARTGFLPEGDGYGHLAMRMYLWRSSRSCSPRMARSSTVRPPASSRTSRWKSPRSARCSRSSRRSSPTTPARAAAASTSSASCASARAMTEPPLVVFTVPDRFEIDGPFVARASRSATSRSSRRLPTPGIGGENGMPPFDEEELRTVLRERIPELRARGVLFPYVIEDTADGSISGGVTLRHFDPMRGVIEVGYWLFADARGRGWPPGPVRSRGPRGFRERAYGGSRRTYGSATDASERVLERAGFTREGIKRRLLRHDGERVDATGFSLLADE